MKHLMSEITRHGNKRTKNLVMLIKFRSRRRISATASESNHFCVSVPEKHETEIQLTLFMRFDKCQQAEVLTNRGSEITTLSRYTHSHAHTQNDCRVFQQQPEAHRQFIVMV